MSLAPDINPSQRNHIVEGPLFSGVLRFGFPMLAAMLLHGSFNLVDAYFIGGMEEARDPLAAIGNCDPLLMIAVIFANGIATATVAMIARAKGKNDEAAVRTISGQSLILVLAISAVFGGLGAVFAREIGYLMGARGNVLDLTQSYLELMFGGTFTMIVLLQLTSILRGGGSAKGPTIILVTSSVLNVVWDPFLIYGWWGAPKLGLLGAAWATLAARLVGCALAIYLFMRAKQRLYPNKGEWSFSASIMKKLVGLGLPNSAQLIIRVMAILGLIALINHSFTTPEDQSEIAAFGLGVRFDMVALFSAMGWGAAASTYVGQNLGARKVRRSHNATWIAAGCAFVTLGIASAFAQIYAEPLVAIFAPGEPRVIEIGVEYLTIVSLSYAFAGVGIVFALALNGAGSTKAPAFIDGLVYALLVMPLSLCLVLGFDLGRQSVWYAIMCGNIVMAMAYAYWFQRGRWRRIAL